MTPAARIPPWRPDPHGGFIRRVTDANGKSYIETKAMLVQHELLASTERAWYVQTAKFHLREARRQRELGRTRLTMYHLATAAYMRRTAAAIVAESQP